MYRDIVGYFNNALAVYDADVCVWGGGAYVCDEGKNFKLVLYLRIAFAAYKEVYDIAVDWIIVPWLYISYERYYKSLIYLACVCYKNT